MTKSLNILFSPLDWGLGHASRSLPLLQYLESQGHLLMVGVNELTKNFLQEHISKAEFFDMSSYGITYSRSASFVTFAALAPRIFKAKRVESEWVENFVANHKVDLIISDSRFGFRHEDVKSVIISHQLNLQFPKGWARVGKRAQKVNEKWLNEFDEVWIPDEENHYLSGDLSDNTSLKSRFIGIQSRMIKEDFQRPEKEPYILCILSGPEPQRSILEKKIRQQSPQIKKHVIIVGGRPDKPCKAFNCANTTYYNHLDTKSLEQYIQHADLVISRSGYSSLMDYYKLECKKVFLIPSPGQTEQIYLAKRMKEMGICDFSLQKSFSLVEIIKLSSKNSGFAKGRTSNSLDNINGFLLVFNSKI